MSQPKKQTVQGEKRHEPVVVNGKVLQEATISIQQAAYVLDRYKFDKILNGESFFSKSRSIFYGAAAGLLISTLAKIIWNRVDPTKTFDMWEVIACVISIICAFICICGDYFADSERKTIIEEIKSHFKNPNNAR